MPEVPDNIQLYVKTLFFEATKETLSELDKRLSPIVTRLEALEIEHVRRDAAKTWVRIVMSGGGWVGFLGILAKHFLHF